MITIEQLAEKLGETVWSKGDMKRIYLNDAGFNTKKMSTKTFIWQDENGDFKVSCKVECPSQPYQWCESQENEVKEKINEQIESIIKDIPESEISKEAKDFLNNLPNLHSIWISKGLDVIEMENRNREHYGLPLI